MSVYKSKRGASSAQFVETARKLQVHKLAEAGVDLSVRFARVMPKAKAKAEREKAHRYVCPVCGQEVRTTFELSLICGHCNVNMDRLD